MAANNTVSGRGLQIPLAPVVPHQTPFRLGEEELLAGQGLPEGAVIRPCWNPALLRAGSCLDKFSVPHFTYL